MPTGFRGLPPKFKAWFKDVCPVMIKPLNKFYSTNLPYMMDAVDRILCVGRHIHERVLIEIDS